MAYLKPQSPIKYKEDHIYPLTTADQIIMEDGNRLSGVGVILDRPNEFEEGSATGINADSLGGKPADEYLTTEELDAQFIKANLEDAVFGEVAMNHADLADKANFADNASKLENKTINELFAMMFEVEHPVGSLYLSMSETDNPNTKWNVFGISCGWEKVQDAFLLGAGGSYALGVGGGEASHTLVSSEVPSTTVKAQYYINASSADTGGSWVGDDQFMHAVARNIPTTKFDDMINGSSTDKGGSVLYNLFVQGGDQPHNNMPPYLATNIWKRIS